jgi:hypothetical protein
MKVTSSFSAHQVAPSIVTAVGDKIVLEPTGRDIILGRGMNKQYSNHPGNTWFQRLILDNAVAYAPLAACSQKKKEKTAFCNRIVKDIQAEGRRFLKKQKCTMLSNHHLWCIANRSEAREKVQHALRNTFASRKAHHSTTTKDANSPERWSCKASIDVPTPISIVNKFDDAVKIPSEESQITPETFHDASALSSIDWSFADQESCSEAAKEIERIIMEALLLEGNEMGSIEDSYHFPV